MSSTSLLLCTDLDRTLLPNGAQPESPQARALFANLAKHDALDLVYVTGRDQARVRQAINEYAIPLPDFLITDVGTRILKSIQGEWEPLNAWRDVIAPDWQNVTASELRALLSGMDHLSAQEDSKQSEFKLSYYVPLDTEKTALLDTLKTELQKHKVRANLIWSVDEPAGLGLLDILPISATKYHALVFLMQQTGHSKDNTLFAGDSGNDLEILCSEIPSVLVANASDEVRSEALSMAAQSGHMQSLYIAQGGFLGMNGNYSAGILEGFAHFYPHLQHWLDA